MVAGPRRRAARTPRAPTLDRLRVDTLLAIEIRDLVKDYRGLRPLRVQAFAVQRGECVTLSGLDAAAAEVLVNVVNGFVTPDAGEVRIFGQATRDIGDGDAWLASLDRLGLVTPRNVLLERLSVRQNLALPFTVEIEPMDESTTARAEVVGARVGLVGETLDGPAANLSSLDRMRLHLARALALAPALLLLEHPTVSLEPRDRGALGTLVRAVAEAERNLTVLAVTQDRAFTDAAAARALKLDPGTGHVSPVSRGWRFWR